MVWDDDQVLVDEPPEDLGSRLWAEVARELIGDATTAVVTIDCDDQTSELRLRAAGFRTAEVEDDRQPEEGVTLEREGRLGDLLDAVLRLPPDAPLGALATSPGAGVDLDLGAGLDVWGPGAYQALKRAALRLGVALRERPPEE